MDWIRSAKIAGAGAAFAILVAWMVPPTTPKPPEPAAWPSAVKAGQGAGSEPDRYASSAEPASLYPPPFVEPAATQRPPRIRAQAADSDRRDHNEPEPAVVIEHRYSDDDRRDDDDASDDERYRSGYGWAADMQVQDPRECRRWRGDSGEDGCLDFVREQYDRDDRERWAGN